MKNNRQNKAEELFYQAIDFFIGIGKQKNLIRAKLLLTESANLGLTKSIILLGDLYIKHLLPSNDYKEAVALYEKGCELGDNRSLSRLAMCYEKGLGVKKDFKKSMDLYKAAYEAGNKDACFSIARFFEKGIGVERSQTNAISWYRIGSDLGDEDCTCNLAFCYYKGAGVVKDLDKAKVLFLSCSEYNSLVQKNLGVIYYKGTETCKPDKEQAIYWLTKASNNGDSSAMLYLGQILRDNDKDQAMAWYKKAAKIDHKQGAYTYAFFLYKFFKEDNWYQAFNWMKLAAENGHVSAQFMLGLFYKCGVGTNVDHSKAFYWFNLAAENDYEQAYSHIGRYYRDGRIISKNYETALVWFEKAIASNDTNVRGEALYDYGMMFLEGYGVKKNKDKAVDFFAESKSYGCLNAIHKLEELNNPESSIKSTGRAFILEHGDIVQYVKMKIDDGYTESNWVPNILDKLNIYIKFVKQSELVQLNDNQKWQWTKGNIDFAQWVIMVSDNLKLYCLNNKKERCYYPKYFANLFLTKKGKKFKAQDLRHNISAINNPSGCVGEKHFETIKNIVDSAKEAIIQRKL